MAKKHKHHDSRIEIDTALPVGQALSLCRETVETQRSLRLSDEYADGFSALVKNEFGIVQLHFTVSAAQNGERTSVSTKLQEYQTFQNTVYLIPVGPKMISGYGAYRNFMNALAQVFPAADPMAHCAIIEREETAS